MYLYGKIIIVNWERERFKKHNSNHTSPVTYSLEDKNTKPNEGKSHELFGKCIQL